MSRAPSNRNRLKLTVATLVSSLSLGVLCPTLPAGAEGGTLPLSFKLKAVVVDGDGGGETAGQGATRGSALISPGALGPGSDLNLTLDQDGGNQAFAAPSAHGSDYDLNWGKGFAPGNWTVAQNPEAKAGQATKTAAGGAPDPSGKSLDGPMVDWSGWISHLADRWYEKLVILEKQANRNYTTRRVARIKFTVYPDGSVDKISVLRSCGVPEYDKMQIDSLKQAAPFAPFPAGSNRKSYTLAYGWESHKRQKGEVDFKPGSYKKFPTEKIKSKTPQPALPKAPAARPATAPKAPDKAAPPEAAEKTAPKAPEKTAPKSPEKSAPKAPEKAAPKAAADKPQPKPAEKTPAKAAPAPAAGKPAGK